MIFRYGKKTVSSVTAVLMYAHAVIRPVALTEEELAKAPEGTKAIDMIGMPGMKFAITVSFL